MTFIQQNIIVVLGDLGAGSNFVKNVLLLSPEVDFPQNTLLSRLEFIIETVYPDMLQNCASEWITHEYKLRKWQQWYGVDIADEYRDINTPQVKKVSETSKIVFLCHNPNIVEQLKRHYPDIVVVSLYAATEQAVAWQLSQYISKLGIDRMHNFSFEHDTNTQKQQYIQQHGLEQYQKFNALNAYEIMLARKDNYNRDDYITICIEDLQTNSWIPKVAKQVGITIDMQQAYILTQRWKELNPPFIQYWKNNHT